MDPRLMNAINLIGDEELRKKVIDVINDLKIEIDGVIFEGLELKDAPASLSRHHSYPGGLLEHIISTVKIALTLCNCVEEVYGSKVDRDSVLAGVILHDIFKPLMYVPKEGGGYRPSALAEKIDHLTLITAELIRRGFPIDIIHIVCSHHGDAGPLSPKTLEALICHVADAADSTLNGKVLRAARYLIKEVTGKDVDVIDSKVAFEIVREKAHKGWSGVQETLEKYDL